MVRESIKKQVNSVFERLILFLKNSEKELASFENKALMLANHKRYLRTLKRVLTRICPKDKIVDDSLNNRKKVITLTKHIKSDVINFKSYTDIYEEDLEKFEKEELNLLSENLKEIRKKWKNLLIKKDKLFQKLDELNEGNIDDNEKEMINSSFDSFVNILSSIFGIEKEDYDLIYDSYSKMIHKFNDILDSQENALKYEIEILNEIIKEFEADKFLNAPKIKHWIDVCDKLKGELEYLVKKEKEEVHEPFNLLIGKISYSRKRAIRAVESGEINAKKINQDLAPVSRPLDYSRYVDTLNDWADENDIELVFKGDAKRRLRKIKQIGRISQLKLFQRIASLITISEKDSLTRMGSRRTFDYKHKEEFINLFTKGNIFNLKNYTKKPLKKEITFVFFDLDKFKRVNDNYGHRMGDLLLKEVGEIVRKNLRANDIGIRYGGEEFILILDNCNKENAKSFVEDRIGKEIKSRSIKIEDENVKIQNAITISVGIAEFNADLNENLIKDSDWEKLADLNPQDKHDLKKIKAIAESVWYALTKIADERMYYVKENGRDGTSLIKRQERKKD